RRLTHIQDGRSIVRQPAVQEFRYLEYNGVLNNRQIHKPLVDAYRVLYKTRSINQIHPESNSFVTQPLDAARNHEGRAESLFGLPGGRNRFPAYFAGRHNAKRVLELFEKRKLRSQGFDKTIAQRLIGGIATDICEWKDHEQAGRRRTG